jgi:hypothetical protein
MMRKITGLEVTIAVKRLGEKSIREKKSVKSGKRRRRRYESRSIAKRTDKYVNKLMHCVVQQR